MEEGCIFCKIIKGEVPCEKVYEDDKVFALLDLKPSNPGHTLVLPKNHSKNILEASKEDASALMESVKFIAPKLMKAVKAQGFNTIINTNKEAGQIIFHTHIHIIPRFAEDSLKICEGEGIDVGVHDVAKRIKEEFK